MREQEILGFYVSLILTKTIINRIVSKYMQTNKGLER